MKITIATIFPDYFNSPFQQSMLNKAQEESLVSFEIVDIRQYSTDKHQRTDDRPFGGGPGMVMMVEPIDRTLQAIKESSGGNQATNQSTKRKIVLTSAKGSLYTQAKAQEYAQLDQLVIVCGHYEGVDHRVAEHLVDEQVRVGDYVLTGGEPAAAVIADSVTRLIPGVLGNEASTEDESHSPIGQFSYPQYTRPQNYKGWEVPEVLLSGHHQQIQDWRQNKKRQNND